MSKNLKIIFMGTPEFAACSLKEIINSGRKVEACFTNPDKPSGRGMKTKASEVKEYAMSQNIPIYQPKKLRNNEEVYDILKKIQPDLLVVVAYGKILPKEILEIPRLGAINVHGSLLPKYRGAAPIQWSIINGEKITGITTMYMDEGMDTGDMILKEEVEILEEDNFETLHDKMKVVGAKLLIKTLEMIENGTVTRSKQPDEATYAPMINKDMTKIDFSNTKEQIYNFVRGLSPYPGTYIETENGDKYKVYEVSKEECEESDKESGSIVTLSKKKMAIKCSDGCICIKKIQPQNSKKMDISAFLAGNKISSEERFV